MSVELKENTDTVAVPTFYKRPAVRQEIIPIAGGIPFGIETVSNPNVGVGGAYAAWGESIDNAHLKGLIENIMGEPLEDNERMNLAELGFLNRHHIPDLSVEDHLQLELEVGARLLKAGAQANGWQTSEVQAVLIGMSGPVADDYVSQICRLAGIPDSALKVSVHKACDGSVGSLHLALNPNLTTPGHRNIADELLGKKVLIGGIEGLSRFIAHAHDKSALQLFGNGAGVIGIIPGETFKFLVGKNFEAFDIEGVLAVHMYYPHSRQIVPGQSRVEVTEEDDTHIRIAGLMHEPENGAPIAMAGPMGMVKLFVRTGVQVVTDVYQSYQNLMEKLGMPDKPIVVAIVHHANYKINKLKEKHLLNLGIQFPMPWLISEFGNVSAASNMIAFLRQLPSLKPGDHVLFDGFGAGTYYDVLAVSMGG
jgi:hypothetical protein